MLINPSSTRQVIRKQQQLIFEYQDELANAALKGTPDAIDAAWYKLKKVFDRTVSYYPDCIAEKQWSDFDIDSDAITPELIEIIHEFFYTMVGPNFLMLHTHGGIHAMVKTDSLTKFARTLKNDPNKYVIDNLTSLFIKEKAEFSEIIKNDNAQVPVCGCLQGGHLVTVLNKGDYSC
jgi:hypothetical protein